jgi:basic amino acid/polyamine antiporter, APA family
MTMIKEGTDSVPNANRSIFRKKDPDRMIKESEEGGNALKKTLGAFDLTILGIGAIIGAGIFTLSGTAAAGSAGHIGAGPGLILSFAFSGLICCITALCYAELAAMIPIAGSAYTYTYTTLGEVVAWMLGWILMLEYGIGSITVACGWSGYLFKLLEGYQTTFHLPDWLVHPPIWLTSEYHAALHKCSLLGISPDFPTIFGIPFCVNLPAFFIVALMTLLLYVGIKESTRMAAVMVIIKMAVILLFIGIGAFYVQPENWSPFLPNGFPGVFMGAFLVFFAYIGFDAISTTAEETKNPQRDMPIGIISALVICTVIYMIVAAVLTGMVSWESIDTTAPIAAVMAAVGKNWMAGVISLGAVAGLTSVVLVLMLAVSRVLFAMSRDGLLPTVLSKIHPNFQTPHIITLIAGICIAVGTLFLDINKAAELANIGTLTAFTLVCVAVIILRYKDPERKRSFRVPLVPWLPGFGAIASIALILYTFFNPTSPLTFTLIFFSSWVALGLIIYFLYGKNKSKLKEELTTEDNKS